MKYIKAIQPYIYKGLNFKNKAFDAWKELHLPTERGSYPRFLHWLLFRYDIFQTIWYGEPRLVFVQPVSLYFDVSTSVLTHEIIPFFWDCWPCFYDKVESWLKKHKVKTAIFTSSQEMTEIKRRLPSLNVIHCPEGIDSESYFSGDILVNRNVDVLEFGRSNKELINISQTSSNITWVNTANYSHRLCDNDFRKLLCEAKICICFPKSMTHPEIAEGVETLTQRYWECMLSRNIILGHAPKELIDIVGYNPVIEYDYTKDSAMQVQNILNNIDAYQYLVDKNRESALKYGDWKERIRIIYNKICLTQIR